MLGAASRFQNIDGTPFNPLRNFVSELGSEKSSRAAGVFNGSLILSSPLLFTLVYSLGMRIKGRLGYAALAMGFCALLGSTWVGFTPMDQLKLHLIAALMFFWGWLAAVFLFIIGFWRKYSFKNSPLFILAGLNALIVTGAFLAVLTRALLGIPSTSLQQIRTFRRPPIWDVAILEWCVVLSFFAWILAAAHFLSRTHSSDRAH